MRATNTGILTGILVVTICFATLGLFVSVKTTSILTLHHPEDNLSSIQSLRGPNRSLKPPKFAIVHLIDNFNPIYEAALLCSLHRAVHTHSNISKSIFPGQLDFVVMVHEELNLTGYEHPFIRYVPFNGDAIKDALAGKKYPEWEVATHFKLCAMTLVDYDKVVFVDLDFVLRSQLASILLDTTPPAMVQWGEYPQLDFNSGFHILRPNQEMFNDALHALKNIGNYYAATEELEDASMLDALQKHVPQDPSPWAGYRSDQEFMFAFYEILPQTRSKWGPIHNLPYRYNAREESVAYSTSRFLNRMSTITKPRLTPPGVFDGAHLHLFGGFGQDGRGHRLNPIPKEEGMFGLVGVHFTTRKPWKEGRLHNRETHGVPFDEHLVKDLALSPQERCPEFLYHIDFWEGVIDGIMEAMTDKRFGYLWMTDSIFEYIQQYELVKQCFVPELKALLAVKEKIETHLTQDCPDASDCTNKHCRWRRPEQLCSPTLPVPFIPLIDHL